MQEIYVNNKNKTAYYVTDWNVIDATNGREEIVVLYQNEAGKRFVRVKSEFEKKFTKAKI